MAYQLGVSGLHAVDDVVSDTYLAFWNHVGEVANPRAYLARIARNFVVRGRTKRDRGWLVFADSDDLELLAGERGVAVSTEQTVGDMDVISSVLKNLTSQQRLLITLTAQGYAATEIAEMVGLSYDQVRHELRRARQRARLALADHLDEPEEDYDADPAAATEELQQETRRRAAQLRIDARQAKRHDPEAAEALFWQANALGDNMALLELAEMHEGAGDLDTAELAYRRALEAGEPVHMKLARLREMVGDRVAAENLYRLAADSGDTSALIVLAGLRNEVGDLDGAVHLARRAAAQGNSAALSELAWRREHAGDLQGAERLYREAFEAGDKLSRAALARLRELAGDRDEAERIARQAADEGDTTALKQLAKAREFAHDFAAAEALYWEAASRDDHESLYAIARLRSKQGDLDGAAQVVESVDGPTNRTRAGLLRQIKLGQTQRG